MSCLDEERAELLAAMALDAALPSALAAVVEGGIEASIFDEGLGRLEAIDVADEGSEGKGEDVTDAAQAGEFEELRILEDLLGDEAGQTALEFDVMIEFEQVDLQDLGLGRIPGLGREDGLAALVPGEVQEGFGQADAVVAEVGAEGITGGSDPLDRPAVGVEKIAPFLGEQVRDPDGLGVAAEVGASNAGGTDAIVVSVRLLELADKDALQDEDLAPAGQELAGDLEAVAGGLQDKRVGGERVLLRPVDNFGDGHLVEDEQLHSRQRGIPLEDGGGEGIRVNVETDDPGNGG